jgi:hypothetical protein
VQQCAIEEERDVQKQKIESKRIRDSTPVQGVPMHGFIFSFVSLFVKMRYCVENRKKEKSTNFTIDSLTLPLFGSTGISVFVFCSRRLGDSTQMRRGGENREERVGS